VASGIHAVDEYGALVAARKACRICVERSPGRIRSCGEFDFDPDVVSHWEQWLGHRNPKLLVVGQDFGNVGYFERHRGRDEPGNKTNDNLQRLLAAAGVATANPPDPDREAPVFMTNSILCVKEGKMAAPILSSWVRSCTETHLLPLLRYLRPPLVVGMGNRGWQAVRQAFALREAPRRISDAVGGSWIAADRTRVFAVVHCGPLGLTNRPWPQQLADWRRIGAAAASAANTRKPRKRCS
jgi:uracil-DNA glycosylase